MPRQTDPSDREIGPEEVKTLRRIFREFASGKSPMAIAVDPNRDGIPRRPSYARGDTSIRGHVLRGTRIIKKELCAGVVV